MSNTLKMAVAAVALAGFTAGAARADVWATDGSGDRVMKFSSLDGSLIDLNFITNAAFPVANDANSKFLIPFEPKLVTFNGQQEGWVSDQNADAIYRFNLAGQYLGSFLDDAARSDVTAVDATLVNIRGFEVANGKVFVANRNRRISGVLGSGSPAEGADVANISIFDATTGSKLGTSRPPQTLEPFDVVSFQGGLLYAEPSNINISAGIDYGYIQRLDADGNHVENFAAGNGSTTGGTASNGTENNGLRGPHQMIVLDSGNVLVTNTGGGPFGIYEFEPDGDFVRRYETEAPTSATNPLLRDFNPQGLVELENGDIFVSGTDRSGQFATQSGFFRLDLDTGLFTTILKGQDIGNVRIDPFYVGIVPEPTTAVLAAVGALALVRRRR